MASRMWCSQWLGRVPVALEQPTGSLQFLLQVTELPRNKILSACSLCNRYITRVHIRGANTSMRVVMPNIVSTYRKSACRTDISSMAERDVSLGYLLNLSPVCNEKSRWQALSSLEIFVITKEVERRHE